MRNLKNLNLNSLRIVESAARLGNFTRAGEENLISTSAVSQRVKAIEEQLEFKIFHRRSNAVALTPEGEAFVMEVRQALDSILARGLEIAQRVRPNSLKVNVLPTFAVRWLLPRLQSFQVAHPDISLHLSQSYTPVNFNREDVDLSVRYGAGPFPRMQSRLLFKEDLIPVCSPSLLKRVLGEVSPRSMRPADLRHFTLLHSDTCTLNWKSWLEFAGVPEVLDEAPSMSFDSCMLSFEAANSGLGFAVANRAYVAPDIAAGKLVAPFEILQPNENGWHLVYPQHHAHRRQVQAFEAWIIAEAERAMEELRRTAAAA